MDLFKSEEQYERVWMLDKLTAGKRYSISYQMHSGRMTSGCNETVRRQGSLTTAYGLDIRSKYRQVP